MVVSEPIEKFVTRSIGVCGGDVYVRQVPRGNVFGGGRGGAMSCSARARPEGRPAPWSGWRSSPPCAA